MPSARAIAPPKAAVAKRPTPKREAGKSAELARIQAEIYKLPLSYLRHVNQYLEKVRRRKPDEVVILADVPGEGVGKETVVVVADKPEAVAAQLPLTVRVVPGGEAFLASRYATIRNRLLREGFSTPDAAKQLSLSAEGVRQKAARKELFALKLGRDYRFPRWQFKDDSPNGVISGLREVLSASILPPLELAAWFESKMEALGDRTPIEAIQSGDLESVVAAAEAAGVS